MENENNIEVKEGMEATLHVGSDCYPYIVIDVLRRGQQIILQAMETKPAPNSDFYNNQKWITTPNPNGKIIKANKKRRNGHYYVEKYMPVSFGKARMYQDPSF